MRYKATMQYLIFILSPVIWIILCLVYLEYYIFTRYEYYIRIDFIDSLATIIILVKTKGSGTQNAVCRGRGRTAISDLVTPHGTTVL